MRNIYTSIDIGSDTIRILISEYYKKKFYTLAVSSVKSKGVKNGVIVDEGLLSERIKLSLNDIYERIDIEINKALLVIPAIGVEFNLVHGNIPIINMEKMVTKKDIIRVESSVINDIAPNMELVNVTPIDYTIYDNGSEIETTKDPVNKICDRLGVRAMITTVPKVNIISYVKLLENLGIEVVDISLSPICDYEEVRNEEMDNGVTCLINVGKNMTNISVFNKGIITNSTNINIGSKVIDDDISKFIGLWATENDFSENVMIGDHPVRHYYSYNEYVHNNMSHAYFASEDSIYEIKWMGEEITPDIEKLIKNTPASKIDKDTFYNTLDESIDMYKEQKIVKLNQDSEYNYLEAKHQSQSSPQNTHDDTKFNRILLTYYNR